MIVEWFDGLMVDRDTGRCYVASQLETEFHNYYMV